MFQRFGQLKVLIAEDSQLVVSSLKIALREIGVHSSNIITAKSLQDMYRILGEDSYDLVLCDFHFGHYAHGKAVYQHIQHHRLLARSASFVLLTSENSVEGVNGILDFEPDEFIMKPYSVFELKKRLQRLLVRKISLATLYNFNPHQEVTSLDKLCDRLEQEHPKLQLHIAKTKGELLMRGLHIDDAVDHYQRYYFARAQGWCLFGWVESLIAAKQVKQARHHFHQWLVEKKDRSAKAFEMRARFQLMAGEAKGAYSNIEQAFSMIRSNQYRCLAAARLSELNQVNETALSHYKQYERLVAGTYESSLFNTINILRVKLLSAGQDKDAKIFEVTKEIERIRLQELSEIEELSVSIVECHVKMIERDYSVKNSLCVNLIKNYQKLPIELGWYLLSLLLRSDNHYWFEKVYAHFVALLKASRAPLEQLTLEYMFRLIRFQQINRKKQLTEVIESLTGLSESDGDVVLKHINHALRRYPYSVELRMLLIEHIASHSQLMGKKVHPKQYDGLEELLTSSKEVILSSTSLRKEQKLAAAGTIAQATRNFNLLTV